MRRRLYQVGSAAVVLVLLSPRVGLAQWVTWYQFGTEGSYVHETAHLLFLLSMLFFIHEIFHANLQKFRGFRLLVWAWAVLAFWNLDAFIGHFAAWTLTNPVLLGEGLSRKILMYDSNTWLFYITKIDHCLFLVPAFYLFYRGLKVLTRESQGERP